MSIKVLMVNTGVFPLPPEAPAGAEYHVYYLTNYLAKIGLEVHLVTGIRDDKVFQNNVRLHKFKSKHLPMYTCYNMGFLGWILAHALGGTCSFLKYLEVSKHVNDVDLIHVHGRVAGRLVSISRSKKPIVYTVHDQSPFTGFYHGFERIIRHMSYLLTIYKTIQNVDYIIAVSKQIYHELIYGFGLSPEKVAYIPNGVDVEFFKPASIKKPIILFVGRLTKRKGVDLLIQAFAKLNKISDEYKLAIVGDGEEKIRLSDMAKHLGLKNKIIFLSNVPRKVLQRIYSEASIFVLPSRGEGLPLSLLEAMASGCAVIASRVSGVVDIIKHGENGLLVKPNNIDQLVHMLSLLMTDNSLLKKLSKNARKKIIKCYSWEVVAKETAKVYVSVINNFIKNNN